MRASVLAKVPAYVGWVSYREDNPDSSRSAGSCPEVSTIRLDRDMALEFFMGGRHFQRSAQKFREERFSLQKERGVFVFNPSCFVRSRAASSSHASGRARDNDLNSSTFLNAAGPEERALFELSNLPGPMNPVHQFAQEFFSTFF